MNVASIMQIGHPRPANPDPAKPPFLALMVPAPLAQHCHGSPQFGIEWWVAYSSLPPVLALLVEAAGYSGPASYLSLTLCELVGCGQIWLLLQPALVPRFASGYIINRSSLYSPH